MYIEILCIYIEKTPKLKLVRMFGHVAENRSVWVKLTKITSDEWNVETHLIV